MIASSLLLGGKKVSGKRVIVSWGDSITADGGYLKEILKNVPGSTGKNYGYVGKGTAFIATKEAEAFKLMPTDVIILAGVNDLAAGRPVPEITRGLLHLWNTAKSKGARVIAVQITPWAGYKTFGGNAERLRQVNEFIANASVPDVIVRTGEMGDAQGRLQPQWSRDGLHPNPAGQIKLAQLILKEAF